MFNGASLLDAEEGEENGPSAYRVKEGVIAELAEYRARHDLHVGLYVQEGDCDETAADLLSSLVARKPATFDLGFAWGGLRDEVAIGRAASPRLGYGPQRRLGLVGKARQWRLVSTSTRGDPTPDPPPGDPPERPCRIVVKPDGVEIPFDPSAPPPEAEGPPGSLLARLLAAGIPVEHACGGVGACGTCHVYVRGPLSPADDEEEDLLDKVPGARPTSRLACRCRPDGTGDLEVEIPSWNRNQAREQD
ncbi:MAG: 2Fe-2S iron-sulfur cluster binding domain-containing protein [Deltaproteobacteria bacterium]|nr:2Fe-2S iron-sulfur cluster binding domain-containing protein [Deltaproteobacteria bacterium]